MVSAMLFASIHLSTDPWLTMYYLIFGATTALITWRTGGLEVAIVFHAVNNTLSYALMIVAQGNLPQCAHRPCSGRRKLDDLAAVPVHADHDELGVVANPAHRTGDDLTRLPLDYTTLVQQSPVLYPGIGGHSSTSIQLPLNSRKWG
jgi:hypothetical protein